MSEVHITKKWEPRYWVRYDIDGSKVARVNHSALTPCGRDNMAAISQTTLSNAFYWMKLLEFRLKVHWSLFLTGQLIIS